MQARTAPKTQSQVTTIAHLKALGFSDAPIQVRKRLVVALSGKTKTGKTHFACTAPPPIIYINVDLGTEGVLGKFQSEGKQILIYDVRVPKGASKDVYAPMWADLKLRIQHAYELGEGTVVMDTETEVYELARLAHFGKLTQVMPHNYAEVNSEFRDMLRLAYDSTMSTVFIRKMRPKWVNNARTSDYEAAGFGDMEYNAQANLETYRADNPEGGMPEFSVYVRDCRLNPVVNGTYLRGPMCNFEFLMSIIHGSS